MLAGPRPADRYKDRLTVSRFSSQAENQPNLNVFPYTTEVVDPAPIRLVSSSLPNTRGTCPRKSVAGLRTDYPLMFRSGPSSLSVHVHTDNQRLVLCATSAG